MDEPVGNAIGNSLEVIEAVRALKGEMTEDVREIVFALGTQMILMAGKTQSPQEAENMIKEAIITGKAYEKFKELVEKQGGDISYIETTEKFPKAKHIIPVFAEYRGCLLYTSRCV